MARRATNTMRGKKRIVGHGEKTDLGHNPERRFVRFPARVGRSAESVVPVDDLH